ncbi:MAG TPA: ABC transporter ATP-binding protein [Rubricoccaceae bacterium]
MPPAFDARDLGVRLGARDALVGVTVAVAAGEAVALVGPNGAGKTTLLRALAGLLPHSGTLDLHGRPVRAWDARARAREVALVRQQTALAVDFTVAEVVALGRAPHVGWTDRLGPADRAAVDAALAATDLTAFAGRSVRRLSGGEQQRVLLAQALAQDTPALLLDEPTAHLDVRHQLDLLARVRALADAGRTVVAALHDLDRAAAFAGRLLVLDAGRLVADGPPGTVLTPALLADVFGVHAAPERTADGLRIRYFGTVEAAPHPAPRTP